MRNFKRFLTLALAVVMLVSAFAMGTFAAKFTDVDEENETLAKAVNLLSYVGVTKGTTDTTFGTDELVTREQMAAFIYRLVKKGQSIETGSNTSAFTDLEDPTFFYMVSWANNQGIIKGTSATTFDPKGSITLQDAYTMLVRTLGYENEEALPYPFGYIDVAESKKVALNEGLSSEVGYEDALTRGDVAVLLYNTFFAETGVAETKTVEKEIGKGSGNSTWVLETVTSYPVFCVKYFDVVEVEYQVVATPNYVFGDAADTTADLGYDALELVKVDDDSDAKDAPEQFYCAFEDLGFDGKADDYIMAHINMYVTLDDEDDVDEILYAESLMTKKTVNELKLGTFTSNTQNSYYPGSDLEVKKLNGKVEFDGEVAYFYNAPYSYATPKYTTSMDDVAKYDERNAKNLKFIKLSIFGSDYEDGEYAYSIDDTISFVDNNDEYFANDSATLIDTFIQVYTNGLYEADFYDVDGDGIYDYINYKPYSAYFVDTDEDYTFYDDNDTLDPGIATIYTEGAVIDGVEFKDEDLVIGYFDFDANYIKAVEVVKPIEGAITGIKSAKGTITLNGKTTVSVKDGWKALDNYDKAALIAAGYVVEDVEWDEFDSLLSASAYEEDNAKFYVYNDVLLYQDGIDSFVTFNNKLIVVTADEDGNWLERGSFNSATGKRTTFVHVWVDGETKYVPVDTDADVYPELDDSYLDQLATYSVDGDGLYTIELLGYAEDKDGEYKGITWIKDFDDENNFANEDDDEIQGYAEVANAYLVKTGTRYALRVAADSKAAKVDEVDVELLLNDNTIVLVKNTYTDADGKDVIDFIELAAKDITDTVVSELTDIKVIVANNTDHKSREFLLVLYATVDGKEFELKEGKTSTKSERIVKMMDVEKNANGKYYVVYDLFNPYTGATVENVPGEYTSSSEINPDARAKYGDVVEVTTDNKVADKRSDAVLGTILGGNEGEDTYWVREYIASENVIEVVRIPTRTANEDIETAVDEAVAYRIDVSDAAVTIIGHQSNNGTDMVRWGSLKVGNVAKLDGSDKSYLAVAKWAKDEKSPLKTVYSNYVKIYLNADWEDEDNRSKTNKDDINAEANFIVVLANNGEAQNLCVLK